MGKSLLTHQTSLAKPEKSTCPGSDIFGLGKASTSGPSMGTPRLLGAEDEDCPLYLKASKMPFLISSAASKNRMRPFHYLLCDILFSVLIHSIISLLENKKYNSVKNSFFTKKILGQIHNHNDNFRHKSSKIVYKQINISHLTRSHKAQAQTKRH
ncbi:hypothetical protein CICLE_v10013003mg [Citrus x clementina]|uniref:Uncharacterized protein n=1 Tax=Citrus clementina TaxID=85681 RepID=V4UUE7_CITCL|nr:hypothetical protein CICLE_v10013003mg [Citrus x clementina]